MENENKILSVMKKNNGTITSKEVMKLNIHRQYLKILENDKLIEKVARGVYILPEYFEDQMYVIQQKFRRGIFSHGTALYLHGLTDKTPSVYTMTFPNSYNTSNVLSQNINTYQSYNKYYSSYQKKIKTNHENIVLTYTLEKTLCDIVRGNSRLSSEEVTNAFKMYAKRNDKNLPLLFDIAKTLRVEKKVNTYMEVLI
ncbi:MAG: type IV toxin-antitoxin system AbiEi family antitoxin domain-containing protein [Firmicutes bacterium]|nr:type IV toxin-antitoxin system AbiEi family antitoxin domain-containing protein [Bacillota bacterium]